MNSPEKHNIPYELIARYFSGEANPDDIIDIERWKASSEENLKAFSEYERIWKKTGQSSIFADIDVEEEWDIFSSTIELVTHADNRRKIWLTVYRIAAIILLGVILSISGLVLNNNLRYENFHAKNSVLNISLPDGSKVSLNKQSSIKYKKSFKENREIELKGEAFFEVIPNPEIPFLVRNKEVFVEVLGTSFSVRAYRNENTIDVAVESGIVAVFDSNKEDSKQVLRKGDQLTYLKESRSMIINQISDPNYHSWKTGILVFSDFQLGNLISKLEDLYDVKIIARNPSVLNCRITVKFENKSIDYILRTLSKTLDFEVEKNANQYIITGEGC
jgi:transmembrane sensor